MDRALHLSAARVLPPSIEDLLGERGPSSRPTQLRYIVRAHTSRCQEHAPSQPSHMNKGGIGDSHGLGNQGIVEEGFEAAKTFLGARSGFVFKKGLWGVGYYPDLTKDAQPRRPHKPPDGVVRPSASRCHYEVLGVAMLAGDDELRKAYRQMALKVRAGVLTLRSVEPPCSHARARARSGTRTRTRARLRLQAPTSRTSRPPTPL